MASQAVVRVANRVARVPKVRAVNHITCLPRVPRATCFQSQVKSRGITERVQEPILTRQRLGLGMNTRQDPQACTATGVQL